MKQWLEINITINGFNYAAREEVDDINEIYKEGEKLARRLHEIVNKREGEYFSVMSKPIGEKIKVF